MVWQFIKKLPESHPRAHVNISIMTEAMAKFGLKLTREEAARLQPTHSIKGLADTRP